MQDMPGPQALIAAVSTFLRAEIAPNLDGAVGFQLRVALNALEIVSRQLTLAPAGDAAELESLGSLLGGEGTLDELNIALCQAIEAGRITIDDPSLRRHLWQTTMAKLAVDQPNYATYLRALDHHR